MIMHPFFNRWPRNTAKPAKAPSPPRCASLVNKPLMHIRLWLSGAGRQISALCSISIHLDSGLSPSLLNRSIFSSSDLAAKLSVRSFIRKRVGACGSNTDIESCQLKLARHYNWCHPAIPSSPTRIQWSNVFSPGSLAPRSASPSRPSPTNSPRCRSTCPHAAPENNLPHTEYLPTCSSFCPPSIARTDRTTMLHKPLLPISQRKRKRAATFVPLTSPHTLEGSTQNTLARVAKRPRCIVTERVRTTHRECSSVDLKLVGL